MKHSARALVAGLCIAAVFVGCGNIRGGPIAQQNGGDLSIEEVMQLGVGRTEEDPAVFHADDLGASALAELEDVVQAASATDGLIRAVTVYHDPELEARGKKFCSHTMVYTAHSPGCRGHEVLEKRWQTVWPSCPHRGYTPLEKGVTAIGTCSNPGCVFSSRHTYRYHKRK